MLHYVLLCFTLDGDDEVMLNVLGCRLTYLGQAETSAEARFNKSSRPRKPEGSFRRTAQDGHLDSHAAPELCCYSCCCWLFLYIYIPLCSALEQTQCPRMWFYMSDELFYRAFLNSHRSGVLTALAWLVPHETAAISALSVYTIQPCTMSLRWPCAVNRMLKSSYW